MNCEPEGAWGERGNWERLKRKAYERRIPLFGGMELTNRCNLQCVHCYINTPLQRNAAAAEMTTVRIHRLVDEVADAGCLFYTLTGGEPLLHPDFEEIYRHLKRRGIEIYLFTNGTLVEDAHVRLFQELPPFAIQFSLYGATRKIYETVTGVPGSFDRCMAGLHRLIHARMPVTLALPVLRSSHYEIEAMRRLARELGIPAKTNIDIHSTADGDPAPLRLRLTAEEAVALESKDPSTVTQWRMRAATPLDAYRNPGLILECNAGFFSFHVLADGTVRPCTKIVCESFCGNLGEMSFSEIWTGQLRRVTEVVKPKNSSCFGCPVRKYCSYCGATCISANGRGMYAPIDSFRCEVARLKAQQTETLGEKNGNRTREIGIPEA